MKQGLSPAVIVVIVVVVLVVIGAIGYFAVLKPKGAGAKVTGEQQKKIQQTEAQKMQEMMGQRKAQPKGSGGAVGPPPGGGGGGVGLPPGGPAGGPPPGG